MIKKHMMWLVLLLVLVLQVTPVLAEADEEDMEVFGLELEKLMNLASGLLALILTTLTFFAYRRSKRSRLLWVSLAFLIYAVKMGLMGAEIFFGEWIYVDPVTSVMDFAILISFFIGLLKK